MKKILVAVLISVLLTAMGCGNPGNSKASRMRVALVTGNVAPESLKLHTQSVVPGTTDKFFGVARNGYIIMYNEFQVTSILSEGTEIISDTVDSDFTWHILSKPGEETCDDTIGNGINCPYDPTLVGKYRLRLDFHDPDGIYPDQSFNGVAIYYSGIWLANPVMVSTEEVNAKGYHFESNGTITTVDNKASADFYLGDPGTGDQNCILAPNGGIVKIATSYDEMNTLINFNPDDYNFQPKLSFPSVPSQDVFGIFLVKCQNGGYVKVGIFSYGYSDGGGISQLYGWYEYTATNSFLDFE